MFAKNIWISLALLELQNVHTKLQTEPKTTSYDFNNSLYHKAIKKVLALLDVNIKSKVIPIPYNISENPNKVKNSSNWNIHMEMKKLVDNNKTVNFLKLLNEIKHEVTFRNKSMNNKENEIEYDVPMDLGIVSKQFNKSKILEKQHTSENPKEFDDNFDYIKLIIHRIHSLTAEELLEANRTGRTNNRFVKSKEKVQFWKPSTDMDPKSANTRRIFRPKFISIRKFPFVVSVFVLKRLTGGGAIIASDFVITAASCLQLVHNNRFFREKPQMVSVRVGSNNPWYGGEVIYALEVYFHPSYNPRTLENNLAIMRLQRHIVMNKRTSRRVRKISLDRTPMKITELVEGGVGILGWGYTGAGLKTKRHALQYTMLDLYNLAECKEVYSSKLITYRHFCAGFMSKGGGACNKDAGNPGVAYGVLVGVSSFGAPECGAVDSPTVFTKVGYYSQWIDSILFQELTIPPSLKRHTEATVYTNFNVPQMEYTESVTTRKIKPLRDVLRELSDPDINPFEEQEPSDDNFELTTVENNYDNEMLKKKLIELLGGKYIDTKTAETSTFSRFTKPRPKQTTELKEFITTLDDIHMMLKIITAAPLPNKHYDYLDIENKGIPAGYDETVQDVYDFSTTAEPKKYTFNYFQPAEETIENINEHLYDYAQDRVTESYLTSMNDDVPNRNNITGYNIGAKKRAYDQMANMFEKRKRYDKRIFTTSMPLSIYNEQQDTSVLQLQGLRLNLEKKKSKYFRSRYLV